jgi:hypothetical protein
MDWLKLGLLNILYFLPGSVFFYKGILPLDNKILMAVSAVVLIAIYAFFFFRITSSKTTQNPDTLDVR